VGERLRLRVLPRCPPCKWKWTDPNADADDHGNANHIANEYTHQHAYEYAGAAHGNRNEYACPTNGDVNQHPSPTTERYTRTADCDTDGHAGTADANANANRYSGAASADERAERLMEEAINLEGRSLEQQECIGDGGVS
jgi:hypothetical protein